MRGVTYLSSEDRVAVCLFSIWMDGWLWLVFSWCQFRVAGITLLFTASL